MPMLLNFALFQIGWFACVLGGANNLPWLGSVTVLIVVALHLGRAVQPAREATLVLGAGAIGAIYDSTLVSLGLMSYPSGTVIAGTAPHWLIAMWMLFATTLNVSLRWLRGRWLLAATLGAVFGPLAYYGGAKLGGMMFENGRVALIALAVGWACWMPLLSRLSQHLDGTRGPLAAVDHSATGKAN
ncbi:MAG: DUF2878 domain-containing protein [Pseudomonadota bacterium]|nr:MAG: DUF2878 domain-containing protein [Pseudomonadota bacterium]